MQTTLERQERQFQRLYISKISGVHAPEPPQKTRAKSPLIILPFLWHWLYFDFFMYLGVLCTRLTQAIYICCKCFKKPYIGPMILSFPLYLPYISFKRPLYLALYFRLGPLEALESQQGVACMRRRLCEWAIYHGFSTSPSPRPRK